LGGSPKESDENAPSLQRYALRFAVVHQAAVGDWAEAATLTTDWSRTLSRMRDLGDQQVADALREVVAVARTVPSPQLRQWSRWAARIAPVLLVGGEPGWTRFVQASAEAFDAIRGPARAWLSSNQPDWIWFARTNPKPEQSAGPNRLLTIKQDDLGSGGVAEAYLLDGPRILSVGYRQVQVWDLRTNMLAWSQTLHKLDSIYLHQDEALVLGREKPHRLYWRLSLTDGAVLEHIQTLHAWADTEAVEWSDGAWRWTLVVDDEPLRFEWRPGQPATQIEQPEEAPASPSNPAEQAKAKRGTRRSRELEASPGTKERLREAGYKRQIMGRVLWPDQGELVWTTSSAHWVPLAEGPIKTLRTTTHTTAQRGVQWVGAVKLKRGVLIWDSNGFWWGFDPHTAAPYGPLEGHVGYIAGVTVLADDRVLSWSSDKTICIWEFDDFPWSDGFEPPHTTVYETWALGGARLATTGADRRVVIWDMATGTERRRLEGHTDVVLNTIQDDQDGIWTASNDNTVRYWPAAGEPLVRPLGDFPEGMLALTADRVVAWTDIRTPNPEAPRGLQRETSLSWFSRTGEHDELWRGPEIAGAPECHDGKLTWATKDGEIYQWSPNESVVLITALEVPIFGLIGAQGDIFALGDDSRIHRFSPSAQKHWATPDPPESRWHHCVSLGGLCAMTNKKSQLFWTDGGQPERIRWDALIAEHPELGAALYAKRFGVPQGCRLGHSLLRIDDRVCRHADPTMLGNFTGVTEEGFAWNKSGGEVGIFYLVRDGVPVSIKTLLA